MASRASIGVFWFRRDLRLSDNLGLANLCKCCDCIVPVFCLDPRQLDFAQNAYGNSASVQFMFESLVDLDKQIKATHANDSNKSDGGLTILQGMPHTVLPKVIQALFKQHPDADVHIGWNEDVTPFSRKRDQEVIVGISGVAAAIAAVGGASRKRRSSKPTRSTKKQSTPTNQVHVHRCSTDVTVVPVLPLRTGTGSCYTVFTPFCRKARSLGVALPLDTTETVPSSGFVTLVPSALSPLSPTLLFTKANAKHALHVNAPDECPVKGGRTEALLRLTPTYLKDRCERYQKQRDAVGYEHTTRLSAYLKFGCISFREAHLAISTALRKQPVASEALTRELFWAAFYAYITYHFPHVLGGQVKDKKQPGQNLTLRTALHGKLGSVWNAGGSSAEYKRRWTAWTTGQTGYPFIDAAMRQLNTTGWMHNRARMVVANFLTKDLRIDWRDGERYFAQRLVDYDPSSNSGGWQWAAGTGADAQPYHRVFNPWTQAVKFDSDAVYVHRYVSELRSVPASALMKWDQPSVRDGYLSTLRYPAPIVDHASARKAFLDAWKQSDSK